MGLLLLVVATFPLSGCSWGEKRDETKATGIKCAHPASDRTPVGTLRGDIDGDGRFDTVTVALFRHATRLCIYQLEVITERHRSMFTPVLLDPTDAVAGDGPPSLSQLIELDGTPGFEIVVTISRGASITRALVFDYAGGAGAITRVSPNVLEYGGGLDNRVSVDCAGQRRIIVTNASIDSLRGDSYVVERQLFTLVRHRLQPVRASHSRMTFSELRRLPEFQYDAFHSCRHPGRGRPTAQQ